MKFSQPISIQAIAEKYNARLIGKKNLLVTGINEIHKVEKGDLTFVDVKKYYDKSLNSAASVIIINEAVDCPIGKALLVCEQPFEVYNDIVKTYRPEYIITAQIDDTAEIDPSAIIERGAIIGPYVKIGANSRIEANVVLYSHVEIGANVRIQAGSLIGTDAFYFQKTAEGYQKWRSGGRVIIEDKVDIGAGCTINKGVSGDTIIGEGSKLDSQVHIGHGVVVGKNCLFAAQVGIGGKAIIEDNVVLYGQVGVAPRVTIGAKATVLAKSGVSKSLPGHKVYFGYPAGEMREVYKELAAVRHLPEFFKNYYS